MEICPWKWTWKSFLCPCKSSGKNIGVGCHSLFQGIFPSQGSNWCLLHHRQILYCLSHQGSPGWITSANSWVGRVGSGARDGLRSGLGSVQSRALPMTQHTNAQLTHPHKVQGDPGVNPSPSSQLPRGSHHQGDCFSPSLMHPSPPLLSR